MRHIPFLILLFLSGNNLFANAQHPAAKFDQFGDVCCNDEKARLDNFAVQLQNESDATGYIIFYGGRRYHSPFCSSKRVRLARRGEAELRAARLKHYILDAWPGFDGKRIVVVNGGYREWWEAELWIVPPGQQLPAPTPTVKPSAMRFRRGHARVRDYRCEV